MRYQNRLNESPYCVVAIAIVAMCCVGGCGGDGLTLGDVSGKVTLDGKPVPNAFVTFQPQFSGRPSMAKADENGEYELRFNLSKWGALVGEHHVRISTEDRTPDDKLIPELIPEKYRSTDGFIPVTVESGKNVVDLQLTSDGEQDTKRRPQRKSRLSRVEQLMLGEE